MKKLFITIIVVLTIVFSSVCFNQTSATEINNEKRNYGEELYNLLQYNDFDMEKIAGYGYVRWDYFDISEINYNEEEEIFSLTVNRPNHKNRITSRIKIFDYVTSALSGRFFGIRFGHFGLNGNDYVIIGNETIYFYELNEKTREDLIELYNNVLSAVVEKLEKEISDSKERKNKMINGFINAK